MTPGVLRLQGPGEEHAGGRKVSSCCCDRQPLRTRQSLLLSIAVTAPWFVSPSANATTAALRRKASPSTRRRMPPAGCVSVDPILRALFKRWPPPASEQEAAERRFYSGRSSPNSLSQDLR